MDMRQLALIQAQIANTVGYKVDVYHSEAHRGVLAVPHGEELRRENVVYAMEY